jgi:hypothetical protein
LVTIEKANVRLDEATLKIENKIVQNNKDKIFINNSKEKNNFKLYNLNKQITMKRQLLDALNIESPTKKMRSNMISIVLIFFYIALFISLITLLLMFSTFE